MHTPLHPTLRRGRAQAGDPRRSRAASALAAVAVMLLAVTGCAAGTGDAQNQGTDAGSTDAGGTDAGTTDAGGDATLFAAGATPDYQLGGAYPPAAGVGVVGRDRSADPAPGVYSICYVNGFQTQPGELDSWDDDLILKSDGEPVFDPDWPDEALVDTSTEDRRARIAAMITPWIEGCADSGFDAVEFDNLDSYTRSDDALSLDDNVALATLLVDAAHGVGLAAGQKNAAEQVTVMHEQAGFDFAVTEECAVYRECGSYTEVYGDAVIDIEYSDALPRPFAEMCADEDSPASMVLRDRDLRTPDDAEYVFEVCPR